MYPLLSVSTVKSILPSIKDEGVSPRARKPDGFTSVYLREGREGLDRLYPGKSHSYLQEREYFVGRHLKQFLIYPTRRRYLALIAWAYKPDKEILR